MSSSHLLPLLYSEPSNDFACYPKSWSATATCSILCDLSHDYLSNLAFYFSPTHYSPVILIQIFACPKHSKCGPTPAPLYLLFSLITHLIHLCSNFLLWERPFRQTTKTITNTTFSPSFLFLYIILHLSMLLLATQHIFISLFLNPTHWNITPPKWGFSVHCFSLRLWECT